jgi:predicted lipase
LINDLKNILNDQTVIVCTGHSLGASLATICFADILSNKISKNITLYSYGSPRVGNNAFVDLVNGKGTSYRIVNNEDLIPQLILSIMIKGQNKFYYEHIDKTIPFSMNLEDYQKNHTEAYEKYLNLFK